MMTTKYNPYDNMLKALEKAAMMLGWKRRITRRSSTRSGN